MIFTTWITVFCISVLPLAVTDEVFAIDPIENLKFLEMEMALFTGESIVKEELIVREILELKRSVFLLKALLNRTEITSTVPTCGIDQFKCSNGKCISATDRCNNQFECTDHSDEEGCVIQPVCPEGGLSCKDGQCVDPLSRCDGRTQCRDKSDEIGCHNNTIPRPTGGSELDPDNVKFVSGLVHSATIVYKKIGIAGVDRDERECKDRQLCVRECPGHSAVTRDVQKDKNGVMSILNRLRNTINMLETENKKKDKTVLNLEDKVKRIEMQLKEERDTKS